MNNPYQSPESNQNNQVVSPQGPKSMGDDAGMRFLLPVGRSGWAIAAGYLGLFGLVVIPAPLALIVSIIAILEIKKSKRSEKPKRGLGRAIFGLIVGILGSIVLAIFFVERLLRGV